MTLVLVADDSQVQQLTCKHILMTGGFDVLTVGDGQAAWDAMQGMNVDLLIADVRMPRLDGFELLDTIRNSQDLRHVPVIMLTALGQEEAVLQRGKATAVRVLSKPVSSWELLGTVQQMLKEGRS